MSTAHVRIDIAALPAADGSTSRYLSGASDRQARTDLMVAFECSPEGSTIIINIGKFAPICSIDTDTWLDADRRFSIIFEGSPVVLREWIAASRGEASWQNPLGSRQAA